MKTPHKHAELIKLWADGAEIEFKNTTNGKWQETTPSWGTENEYRVKPEPKPKPKPDVVMYYNPNIEELGYLTHVKCPCDTLKLTFDGTTKKLIKAEVI